MEEDAPTLGIHLRQCCETVSGWIRIQWVNTDTLFSYLAQTLKYLCIMYNIRFFDIHIGNIITL